MKDTILHLFKEKFNKDFYEYVSFCLENKYDVIDETYCELHHILPKSKFPEYINSEWNIVRLKYENHIIAHVKLAEIYPIRAFTEPLKFMLLDKEKYNILKIEGIKIWKDSIEYKIWRDKHEILWDSQKVGGDRYQHMLNMNHKSHNDELSIKKRREGNKNSWTDERKKQKSLYNIEKYKNEDERIKLSESCKKAWNEKTYEEKQKHIDERSVYNKSDVGRKKNSEGVRRAYADGTLSKKLSEISKGKVWWNDGSSETKSAESPGENWSRGRITKFKKEQVEKRNKTLKEKNRNANGE